MATHVAVILAAGVGSRLRPLTDDRPKALVPVCGKTILERAVSALEDHGIRRLVIATGYRDDAIHRAMAGARIEVLYRKNEDFATTQNSVSLALCRDALEGEAFFKLDGDLVFDPEILERLDRSEAPLRAAVDGSRMLDLEAMKVKVEGANRIVRFGKEIPVSESAGESIGMERISAAFSRPLFDALARAGEAGETGLYYEDVYTRLLASGAVAEAVLVSGLRWSEIDSRDDLLAAERAFTP